MAACSAPCSAGTATGVLRALREVPVGFTRLGVTSCRGDFCRCRAVPIKGKCAPEPSVGGIWSKDFVRAHLRARLQHRKGKEGLAMATRTSLRVVLGLS